MSESETCDACIDLSICSCSAYFMLLCDIAEDFTEAGKKCATKGVLNEQWGLDCYVDIGIFLLYIYDLIFVMIYILSIFLVM